MDETLLEIGTDKVDTEVPAPAAGVLQEIRVPEGETVDVGTIIAVLDSEVAVAVTGVVASAPEAPVSTAAPEPVLAPAPAPIQEAAPVLESVAGDGASVDVVMPKMGESITEGTVLEWHKQPGDVVEMDETLLEIGTDKVDTEVPSPAAGVLQEILVPAGETVDVGTAIARISAAAGAPAPKPNVPSAPVHPAPAQPVPQVSAPPAVAGDGAVVRQGASGGFYSPLVRSIAVKEGLSMQDLEAIAGSGREGRVTKQDVLGYLKTRSAAPLSRSAPSIPASAPVVSAPVPTFPPGHVEIIEMDRMRQIIAEHMVRSKATSPHVTSFAEADVTNLARLRDRNKAEFLKREGVKLTFTPFFVQAAVEALREHPIMNASVEDKKIIIKHDFHIGIAVAIGKSGLLAPVIRNAGHLNIAGLARASADLAERARSKQLQPDELQSGTFTVTNIGSLGSIMGTPIISQPQVGILATGAIKKRPVVVEDPNLGDIIAIRHMIYLSLSYDHRIIDGAMGSSFLKKLVDVLESYDPNAIL